MPNIRISVKNKIAVQTNRTLYVCGNSDYTALFDLDAEWNAFEIKTARFCYNGHYSDVVFTGNECEIPVIADTNEFEIGLFAGNLHTTTPAMVLCERSILSTSGTPTNPSPDVYHQLIEKINSGMLRGPQGEKGSTATAYAPYENIRPISGREAVSVERCGVNLLKIAPFDTDVYKGVTFEYVPDGGVRIQGTASANVDSPIFPIWHLPPGKYYGLDMGTGIAASIVVQRAGKMLWLNAKGTFEIIKGDIVKYWYMIVNTGYTANKTVYPYIVPGTTAPTVYTPYRGDTLALALPSTVYGGEVDAVSGQGQNAWKLLTLDGTENWGAQQTAIPGKSGFILRVPGIATPEKPEIKGDIVCNQYPAITANDTYQCKNGISVEAEENYYFRIFNDTHAGGTADEWKSYLAAQYAAGTPVQIAYKLAEPVPFRATGAQPVPALAGCNTVLTDADSATVTGRADPAHAIAALQAQLATATQQLVETQAAVVDTTAAIEQDCDAIGGGEDADAE